MRALLAMWFACAAQAQKKSSTDAKFLGTGIEVTPGFNVQARIDPDDASQAIFEIYMKDQTWLGLVLGSGGMAPGSDMIQVKADGINSRVYDKFSQGFVAPPVDARNDLTRSVFRFFEGGYIRFQLTRKLDTGDATDFLIPVQKEWELGWAVNPNTNDLL